MRTEAKLLRIHPERRPDSSVISSNVIHVDFHKRALFERNKIVSISGLGPELTSISHDHKPAEIIELPQIKPLEIHPLIANPEPSPIKEVKKTESYNPGRSKKSYVDNMGRLIIRRRGRGGRCRASGEHPRKDCPTGNPARCRSVSRVIEANGGRSQGRNDVKVKSINSLSRPERSGERAKRSQLLKKSA